MSIVSSNSIVANDNRLNIFAKIIFLKLFPWIIRSFNLPVDISEVYVLNDKNIKNRGIINWNKREALNFPNFEIINDCEASENATSFCLCPSNLNTTPVTEFTPSSKLLRIEFGLKA